MGFEKPRFLAPSPELVSHGREGPRNLAFLELFRSTEGEA